LVHEAGGQLTTLDGSAPQYNCEIPRHEVLAAANAMLQPQLLARLRAVAHERAPGRAAGLKP
jgi:myo-inositol-1(or 4)-monophosphatase